MKKLFFSIFFVFLLFISTPVLAEEFFGIGAELMQDEFSKKVFVVNLLSNMPAQKAGIQAGDEIIAVDGIKIKNMALCEIISKIRGPQNSTVKIKVKKSFFKRPEIEISRAKVITDSCACNLSENHWAQVAPVRFLRPMNLSEDLTKKFSKKFKQSYIVPSAYWFKRKQAFDAGINACANYSKNNQETCLIHLLDREIQKTNTDKLLYKYLKD